MGTLAAAEAVGNGAIAAAGASTGVVFAAFAAALHWKKKSPRVVAFLLFIAGLGIAGAVGDYLDVFRGFSVLGVGLFTVGAAFLAVAFWEEAVKKNGLHRVRTPIVSVAFAICLMSATGAIFVQVQKAVGSAYATMSQIVDTK